MTASRHTLTLPELLGTPAVDGQVGTPPWTRPLPAETCRAAARTVAACRCARADCRLLLDMLGLSG